MPKDIRQRALELNDNVVQSLAVAEIHLQHGDPGKAAEEVHRALNEAKKATSALLRRTGSIEPGDLRREHPTPAEGTA